MEDPTLSLYGAPLLKRKEEIANKCKNPESNHSIEIQGKLKHIPVISVRIQLPVYRLANGRTKSAQLEYLTTHPEKSSDLFSADHDAYDAQVAQHEILKTLVQEEGLLSSFKNDNLEQVDPILCTNTGVVVNGNRRLCAWRMLYYTEPTKYKSFETIQIAILPELDEKAISELEKKLQIIKTMRAEYHWHTKALMAEQELKSGASDNSVAKSFDMKKKDLHNLVSSRILAEQYLITTGHKNEWSRVDKAYYAFEAIVTGVNKIQDQSEKELFKKLAFAELSGESSIEESVPGRLYTRFKDMATHISAIAARLAENIDLENQDNGDVTTEGASLSEPSKNEPEQTNGSTPDSQDGNNSDDLASLTGDDEIPEDKAGEVSHAIDQGQKFSSSAIRDIIEAEKSYQDSQEKADFLLTQLSKIASILETAINTGMNEMTKTDGVKEQINAIQKKLNRILDWLEK